MTHRLRTLCLVLLMFAISACSDTPTSPSDTTTALPPYTVIFESTLAPGGTASRTFTATGEGIVTLTLTSSTPDGISMGIGVGIPTSSKSGCSLSRTALAQAASDAHLQVPVEAGGYCVAVYDVGGISQPARFSLTLVHP
jgi:hypothetical protein